MNIFSKLFRFKNTENSLKNTKRGSVGEAVDSVSLELANLPKDKRLKNFYGMRNFAHYIGFGGESLVKGELLLRGINVAKPMVDDGVDLVVFGDGQDRNGNFPLKFVQVKTAFLDSERNRYSFNLSSIQKGDKINYVFVLVQETGIYNFLIMSVQDIKKEIKKGSIYLNKITQRYRMNVYLRNGKLSLGTVENEAPEFLNNWELFEIGKGIDNTNNNPESIKNSKRVRV